jgi:hypothetical protein
VLAVPEFRHNGVLEKPVDVQLRLEHVAAEQIGVSSKVSGFGCPVANSAGHQSTWLMFIFTFTKTL